MGTAASAVQPSAARHMLVWSGHSCPLLLTLLLTLLLNSVELGTGKMFPISDGRDGKEFGDSPVCPRTTP